MNVYNTMNMYVFDTVVIPLTFNVPKIVVVFDKVVTPDTFTDNLHAVILFNNVFPEIVKVDTNVEGLLKLTNVGGFNIAL